MISTISSSQELTDDDSVLYTGARLVLGDGNLLDNGVILVRDQHIVAVAEQGSIEVPDTVTTIQLAGKTVTPTFIDAHAHLGYEGYGNWGADNYTRENLISHLNHYAYYGFGAVFSAGSDPDELALELQQAQLQGEVGGARFLFAAGMAPGGQGPNNQFLVHALAVEQETQMTVLRGVDSPEQVEFAIKEVAEKGIPFVKIWVDDRGGSQRKLQPELYRLIIDAARDENIKVFAHQQFIADMPPLLEAGVSGFLHGRLGIELDDNLAVQLKNNNTFLIPNLGIGELRNERVADDPFLQETLHPSTVEHLAAGFNRRPAAPPSPQREMQMQEAMQVLLDAGVDVVLGTDAGAVPDHLFGYTGHRELEIFVRLGMTPMQAIIAATSAPARHLGLDESGILAPGMRADFIVFDADPSADISNTRTISAVYLGGKQVDREGLRRQWLSTSNLVPE